MQSIEGTDEDFDDEEEEEAEEVESEEEESAEARFERLMSEEAKMDGNLSILVRTIVFDG